MPTRKGCEHLPKFPCSVHLDIRHTPLTFCAGVGKDSANALPRIVRCSFGGGVVEVRRAKHNGHIKEREKGLIYLYTVLSMFNFNSKQEVGYSELWLQYLHIQYHLSGFPFVVILPPPPPHPNLPPLICLFICLCVLSLFVWRQNLLYHLSPWKYSTDIQLTWQRPFFWGGGGGEYFLRHCNDKLIIIDFTCQNQCWWLWLLSNSKVHCHGKVLRTIKVFNMNYWLDHSIFL